jgi:hypothetical protein
MNIVLWVCQTLLAAVFFYSAATKGTWSKEKLLARGQTGVAPVPLPLLRVIAAAECLGAVGLIVPQLTGVAAFLTPLAAFGLGVVMVGAATIHFKLHEQRTAFGNLALLSLCVFVAVGRVTIS